MKAGNRSRGAAACLRVVVVVVAAAPLRVAPLRVAPLRVDGAGAGAGLRTGALPAALR